jgi:hypothetical protein
MEMQSVCTGITAPKLRLSTNRLLSNEIVSTFAQIYAWIVSSYT